MLYLIRKIYIKKHKFSKLNFIKKKKEKLLNVPSAISDKKVI